MPQSDKAQSDIDYLLEVVGDINPESMYPTDMKEAIIGYVERFGQAPLILLDKEKCLEILMRDGAMDHSEALEFFEFNTIGAWMGEGTPCFATLTKDVI